MRSWRSRPLLLIAMLVSVEVRGAPGAVSGSGGEASSKRGLTVESVPTAMPLAGATPATEYAQRHYARRIAVTIGINAYSGRPWSRLGAAVADAQRMAALFRAMGFDHVESLVDEAASRDGILDLLERRLPQEADEQDLVVVFFAGHGATAAGQGYIVPRDAGADVQRTAISVQRLKEAALRMHARHTIFLADACFSGTMLRRAEAGVADKANTLAYWEAAAKDRVVQILTAGRADERVLESNGWGHFTRAVHAGLIGGADRNHDGVVTTEELALYISARVLSEGQGRQHPQWGTMDGSGTALLLDVRRLPRPAVSAPTRSRPVVRGLEVPLGRIHGLMARREWAQAEKLLRDLMIEHGGSELRLLLAEVYIEMDTLGNASLIDAELRRAAETPITPEQQRRMLDLRARLSKARRGRL